MLLGDPTHVNLRILFLAHATANGQYARDCLETLGMSAIDVGSPLALRDLLCNEPADLLIIDGDDDASLLTVRELKSIANTMLTPVLAVCGTDDVATGSMAAGADEAVTRASGPRSLLALVEALLEQSGIRRRMHATLAARERQLKSRIRASVCRYLSPQLADRVIAEVDSSEHDMPRFSTSTRTTAAVMFADMRGFTSMAERLGPADTLKVLNEYFAMLTEIAFRHEGTIFNMSGDSLMIGYGVPVEQRDGTLRAIETGSEMLRGFRDLASDWQSRHAINVGLGIGINDGEVLAGDVGSSQFMSYTMIGDTVNVAARLSQRARAGEMLFSGSVKRALDAGGYDVKAVALPPLTLRGRSGPLDIFCVPLTERQLVDA